MTYCGVCRREIKPRDGRSSVFVDGKQRLVHDEPRWEINCAAVARGWERGGSGLSAYEAAALGRLDDALALSPQERMVDAMGFKDEYDPDTAPKPEGGDFPSFATEDEKIAFAKESKKLEVTAIRFGTSKHGEVAHLDVKARGLGKGTLPDGTLAKKAGRTLTFSFDGTVVTRDHLITQAADWLGANDGEVIPVTLTKSGRTYLIELA